MAHRLLDRGMADRQPAFRQRFAGLVRDLRQPRLVVLFGADGRGVDILQRRGPAAADPHARRPAWGRCAPSAGPKPSGFR